MSPYAQRPYSAIMPFIEDHTVTFAALLPFIGKDDMWSVMGGYDSALEDWEDVVDDANDLEGDQALAKSKLQPSFIVDGPFGEAANLPDVYRQWHWMDIDRDKGEVTFNAFGLAAAINLRDRVSHDYDCPDEDDTGSWHLLGLSGDDSVDYYGGYLDGFLCTLAAYAQAQGIALPEIETTKDHVIHMMRVKQ
jgi:hypothetical protein